jgi:PspA associated protein B
VGLLDAIVGRRSVKGPAARERLFAMTTAYVTLQTEYDIGCTGVAGIVFQALATADFQSVVTDMEQLVQATSADSGTKVESRDDEYGFRWLIFRDQGSVEDLVVAINGVSTALEEGGYGERLLCAVFAFKDSGGGQINFIYNYKRGSWYPFVPAGGAQQRSVERELQLKAQIGGELPIEPELERWFPLWGIPF